MAIGADGLKTGFTKEAGYGLVGSAVQNGLRLIAVVNGLKTPKDRAEEGKKLLEWGFHNFDPPAVRRRADHRQRQGVRRRRRQRTAGRAGPVRMMVPKAGGERLIARIVYTGPVPAPVEKGLPVGALKVWRGDNLVLAMPLKTEASVVKGSLSQRAFDAVTEMVIGLFRAGAERL